MSEIKNRIRKNPLYVLLKNRIIKILYIFPIQNNKIVFDNFGGRGYGDDPKYIAEELRQRNLRLKLIWMTSDINSELPPGIHVVKYGTIRAAYHWITAKVWVDNIKSSIKPKKREGQYYIQTWHSTLGFKKNEADAKNLPSKYLDEAKVDAHRTDLMYSNNDFRFEKYKNHFWYSGEVIKCDVPRIGALMNPAQGLREKVCGILGVPVTHKIVLYAPTFRKNVDTSIYEFDYEKCKEALSYKFGGTFEMLIRLHPNEAQFADKTTREKKVYNATKYSDMQELLAVADVLITDYSGCMFDFGFAKKPVFLFAKDLERYLREERECYFSLSDVPFDLSETEDCLMEYIYRFDFNEYNRKCDIFEEKIGFHDSGQGAKMIADLIIKRITK